jgi:predicted DNA-binding protein (MmcQ/YjbR family)
MNMETIREYCLTKKLVEESFPFGESTLVFKVGGKIFLLMSMDRLPLQFNVKCNPEKAEQLREEHADIVPGFHMNKKHWNTVMISGHLSAKLIREMIDDSYELVVRSLPLAERKKFNRS